MASIRRGHCCALIGASASPTNRNATDAIFATATPCSAQRSILVDTLASLYSIGSCTGRNQTHIRCDRFERNEGGQRASAGVLPSAPEITFGSFSCSDCVVNCSIAFGEDNAVVLPRR